MDIRRIKGALFLLTLLVTVLVGDAVLIFPIIPLLWVAPRLRRRLQDMVAYVWFTITTFCFEHVFNVTFVWSGDAVPKETEPAILLVNHPSRLDWMFLWAFTGRAGTLAREKIFLKSDLRHIPFMGWAMQSFCFLFLRRKWEDDEPYITRSIAHLLGYGIPYQYLFFAEGTDLSPSNLEKDTEFATKRGITVYKHLLHPRTRGFEHLIELMRPVRGACIYDLTIAYEGLDGYMTEKQLIAGTLPSATHIDFRKIDLSAVPMGNAESGEWLKRHWDEKEKRLAAFYASSPRAFAKEETPLSRQWRSESAAFTLASTLSMLFWLVLTTAFVYMLATSHLFKLYAVVAWATLGVISRTGGIDALEQRVVKHAAQ